MSVTALSPVKDKSLMRKENGSVLLARVLLAGFTIVLGFSCVPLVFIFLSAPATLLKWSAYLVLGLYSSVVVRFLLGKHTFFLKWLVALTSFLAGMGLSGRLTHGYIGFSWHPFPYPKVQVETLIAWGMMGAIAWFSLVLDRSKASTVKVKPQGDTSVRRPVSASPKKNQKASKVFGARRRTSKVARKPRSSRTSWKVSARQSARRFSSWLRIARERGGRYFLSSWRSLKRPARTWFAGGASRHLKVRQKPRVRSGIVHLAEQVEHRCPYCLEEIYPDDPRGVKICPICHTRHHLDCWLVTGTCQVPHYH